MDNNTRRLLAQKKERQTTNDKDKGSTTKGVKQTTKASPTKTKAAGRGR
jgi:hypothetical protein